MDEKRRIRLPELRSSYSPTHNESLQVVVNCWDEEFQEDYPLYPAGYEDAVRNNKTWFRVMQSRFFLMVVVEAGEMIYSSDDEDFLLRGNKVLIIPQGITYSFKTTSKPYYRKISLRVLGVNLSNILDTLGLNKMMLIDVPDLEEIISAMREINNLIISHNIEDMAEMAGKTLTLLGRIARNSNEQGKKSLAFQVAKARLNSNFGHKMKISDLASSLGVSVITLERLFKKELNMTPGQYHLLSKMEHAKDLLLNSNFSIKEIALQLGYCHQFHFSNEFKRLNGETPYLFRRNRFSIISHSNL